MEIPQDLITIAEAAERQPTLTEPTLYRWVREKQIPAWRVGHRVWLSAADVDAVVRPYVGVKSRGCDGFK